MAGRASNTTITTAFIGAGGLIIVAVIEILPNILDKPESTSPPASAPVQSESSATPSAQAPSPTGRAVTDVTGLHNTQAFNRLQDDGFDFTPEFEASNTVPMGLVIRTEPAAKTMVTKGSRITVVISSGPSK